MADYLEVVSLVVRTKVTRWRYFDAAHTSLLGSALRGAGIACALLFGVLEWMLTGRRGRLARFEPCSADTWYRRMVAPFFVAGVRAWTAAVVALSSKCLEGNQAADVAVGLGCSMAATWRR